MVFLPQVLRHGKKGGNVSEEMSSSQGKEGKKNFYRQKLLIIPFARREKKHFVVLLPAAVWAFEVAARL